MHRSGVLWVGLLTLISGATGYYHKDISFERYSRSPPTYSVLQATAAEGGNLTECTITEKYNNSGQVTVLLTISDCLDEASMQTVKDWVGQIGSKADANKYFKTGDNVKLQFQTVMIPGACQSLSEANYHGRAGTDEGTGKYEGVRTLAADEARKAAMLERASEFAIYGEVLESLPSVSADEKPVAILSFSNDFYSAQKVVAYEQTTKVENIFNFQICGNNVACGQNITNCIKLKETVDVFLYNPFSVVRTWQCPSVQNGIPVSYVDKSGERKCYCGCPAGSIMSVNSVGSSCMPVDDGVCPCVWSNEGPFYHAIKPSDSLSVCTMSSISTSWSVPAPFPLDNYVSGKKNFFDDKNGVGGPRIEIISQKRGLVVYDHTSIYGQAQGKDCDQKYPLPPGVIPSKVNGYQGPFAPTTPATYTWYDYQSSGPSKIDKIDFGGYGQYILSLTAYDYTGTYDYNGNQPKISSSTCEGCLAIVDHVRPTKTQKCPVKFCDGSEGSCVADTGIAESTSFNIQKASDAITALYKVQDTASNDVCSKDNRCDEQLFEMKDFFVETYTKQNDYKGASQCFNADQVRRSLLQNAMTKKSPFIGAENALQKPVPVVQGQCRRCCHVSLKLKEKWVDYNCVFKFHTERCEGAAGEGCDLKQCLEFYGDTFVSVKTNIDAKYVKDSSDVIAKLPSGGYQTQTQIHRALDCTKFSESCVYKASVNDLIVRQQRFNFDLPGKDDVSVSNFVFWRYKVIDDGPQTWRLFSDNYVQVFKASETKIVVEAWTQCGIAHQFYYYVYLHLNSPVAVCDQFSDMWYQTTMPHLKVGNALCAYQKSNFLELTFDYHPNIGLKYSRENLKMSINSVVCTMEYVGKPAAEILRVEKDNYEIVERFAIDLLRNPTTQAVTSVTADCAFTYAKFGGAKETYNCSRTFTITDCEGPHIDPPNAKCEYDTCYKQKNPGPYEVCGGNHVSLTPGDLKTKMTTADEPCCQSCKTVTNCVPILDIPGPSNPIKRCEPADEEPDNPNPPPGSNPYGPVNEYNADKVLAGEEDETKPPPTNKNATNNTYGAPSANPKHAKHNSSITEHTAGHPSSAKVEHEKNRTEKTHNYAALEQDTGAWWPWKSKEKKEDVASQPTSTTMMSAAATDTVDDEPVKNFPAVSAGENTVATSRVLEASDTAYYSKHATNLAVVGATFLGIVALVAVRRRRAAPNAKKFSEDAYFELLS